MNSTSHQINIIIEKFVKDYINKISKKYNIEKIVLLDIWNKVINVETEFQQIKTDVETENINKKSDETEFQQIKTDDETEFQQIKTDDETENINKKSDETKFQQIKTENINKKSDETEKTKKNKKTKNSDESENIWKKDKQIGESGKEGTCYRVINKLTNEEFAMKEFKPKKSIKKFDSEVSYQRKAGELGIGPKVIDIMYNPPRIVMEMMNRTIEKVIKDQNGILKEDQQNDIISLCKKFDENNIYHCDPNPLNLMEGIDGKFKWIDYGMSIDINIKKHTSNPNLKALKTVFYSVMQGLITRKIICEDNISIINKQIKLD